MRTCTILVGLSLLVAGAAVGISQDSAAPSSDATNPSPGTTGNADNVPYIGGRDPNGNPVRLARRSGHVSNYDEAKVPPFTLPDPLVMSDGTRVKTAQDWRQKRRPEILKFYETEIYGGVPDNAPKVTWEVTETDTTARDGKAIVKKLAGRMGDKLDAPKMTLTMTLPADAKGPVPVLLDLSFDFRRRPRPGGGDQKAAADQKAVTDQKAAGEQKTDGSQKTDGAQKSGGGQNDGKSRPSPDFDFVGELLSRGWGYAALSYNTIQPDSKDRWSEGVIGQTLKEGQTQPDLDQWGTISAWAWGLSRAIDYLEADPAINSKQIAVTGASRLGKTVLWASAQDPRVAAVFANVSGEMGAAIIRRDWGETLDDMAQNFGYQFAGNLQKWVGRWNDLPVDQHMLIALSAPRPVYVNGGLSDQWSDPKGEFLAVAAAGPVYRLLGGKDLDVSELPPLDTPVADGDLAYHYHSGGHFAVPADWTTFLEFAQRHFQAAVAAK